MKKFLTVALVAVLSVATVSYSLERKDLNVYTDNSNTRKDLNVYTHNNDFNTNIANI